MSLTYRTRKAGNIYDSESFANGDSYPDDPPQNIGANGLYEMTDEQHDKLLGIIRSITPYGQLRISRVEEMLFSKKKKPTLGNKFFKITVNGLGETYCTNKGDYHTSNTVYFIMSLTQLKQKCFSKNIYGTCSCSGYSNNFMLNSELKNLFFKEPTDILKRGIDEIESPESIESKRLALDEKYGGDFF